MNSWTVPIREITEQKLSVETNDFHLKQDRRAIQGRGKYVAFKESGK